MTDDNTDEVDGQTTRRALLAAVGIAGAGASGYFVGTAEAQASGSVGTASNPYQHAYIDRRVWVGRTSNPSSPDEGTEIYRSDL